MVSPCQCFHYFPAQSPSLMSYSEQLSLLTGSGRSTGPAAAGFCKTIPLLCLKWILEEIYLDHSLTSLKPNKQTYIVSTPWESINIAPKCTDRVHLFPYSASCQRASGLSLREVDFFSEETVRNAFLKEKGDLPCTVVLK